MVEKLPSHFIVARQLSFYNKSMEERTLEEIIEEILKEAGLE